MESCPNDGTADNAKRAAKQADFKVFAEIDMAHAPQPCRLSMIEAPLPRTTTSRFTLPAAAGYSMRVPRARARQSREKPRARVAKAERWRRLDEKSDADWQDASGAATH